MPQVTTPPTIDGDISDEVWKNGFYIASFFRHGNSSTPIDAKDQTEAWIFSDSKNLYVAFYAHDSQPEKIRASETQRDSAGVFADDRVSIDIDSQNTRRGFSGFIVNARGTQMAIIEGGTASNLTWVGDWKAKTKRVADGWTCEIMIPFKLLRYPKGATAIGLDVVRRMARETNNTIWPDFPATGQDFGTQTPFLPEFTGLSMPDNAPRPVILPYVIGAAGKGASGRFGADVKYPLSTTLTGLLAIKPDFLTVEQSVADINFSYNEQFIRERRPFFAEGNQYFPDSELFYSPRIDQVDTGVKIAGQNGNTNIGFLATNTKKALDGRTSTALHLGKNYGAFNGLGLDVITDNQNGKPDNRVINGSGKYSWLVGKQRQTIYLTAAQSWEGGKQKGNKYNFGGESTRPGHLGAFWEINQLDGDFISNLGLLSDRNRRGGYLTLVQGNQFDKGKVESYFLGLFSAYGTRTNGAFFNNSRGLFGEIANRRGLGIEFDFGKGRRRNDPTKAEIFSDRNTNLSFSWNGRTLFQKGNISLSRGKQGGESADGAGFAQGFLINKQTSANLTYNQQKYGNVTTRQSIGTGTLRIDDYRTVSVRYLYQNGTGNTQNVGRKQADNLYFAYSQRLPQGTDAFLILGNPNATRTRGEILLKITRPY
jgi:hypothetical protein